MSGPISKSAPPGGGKSYETAELTQKAQAELMEFPVVSILETTAADGKNTQFFTGELA